MVVVLGVCWCGWGGGSVGRIRRGENLSLKTSATDSEVSVAIAHSNHWILTEAASLGHRSRHQCSEPSIFRGDGCQGSHGTTVSRREGYFTKAMETIQNQCKYNVMYCRCTAIRGR